MTAQTNKSCFLTLGLFGLLFLMMAVQANANSLKLRDLQKKLGQSKTLFYSGELSFDSNSSIPVSLALIERSYSDYDQVQSRGFYKGKKQISGLLIFHSKTHECFAGSDAVYSVIGSADAELTLLQARPYRRQKDDFNSILQNLHHETTFLEGTNLSPDITAGQFFSDEEFLNASNHESLSTELPSGSLELQLLSDPNCPSNTMSLTLHEEKSLAGFHPLGNWQGLAQLDGSGGSWYDVWLEPAVYQPREAYTGFVTIANANGPYRSWTKDSPHTGTLSIPESFQLIDQLNGQNVSLFRAAVINYDNTNFKEKLANFVQSLPKNYKAEELIRNSDFQKLATTLGWNLFSKKNLTAKEKEEELSKLSADKVTKNVSEIIDDFHRFLDDSEKFDQIVYSFFNAKEKKTLKSDELVKEVEHLFGSWNMPTCKAPSIKHLPTVALGGDQKISMMNLIWNPHNPKMYQLKIFQVPVQELDKTQTNLLDVTYKSDMGVTSDLLQRNRNPSDASKISDQTIGNPQRFRLSRVPPSDR